MMSTELLSIWSDHPAVSLLIWLTIVVVSLYLARRPAHQAIKRAGVIVRNAMRLAARSVGQAERRLATRNREVLLAAGQEASERLIEREFHRVNAVVTRDLSAYPSLHRRLSDQIERIDEDYRQSAEMPPNPPGWTKAVEAVAKLRTDDSSMVGKVLGDIHTTVARSERNALEEYRRSNAKRHSLLKGMMPYWRKLSQALDDVHRNIQSLDARSQEIDGQMAHYEKIRSGSANAERMLSSSSMTQFFIAGLVLVIAAIGGIINFYLIAMPMSEMVGGNSMLGPFRTSGVAALVIIMIEIAMGLFLMESLRITRMFPVIGSMDDQMRKRMIWFTFAILFVLACVESSLAFMRDMLAADREALRQTLSGAGAAMPEFRWIPSIGQMVMGFVLPFALTFVAIPLESFIHASRTVTGVLAAGLLRALAFALRLFGNLFYNLGMMLVQVYDLLIFIPLRIEEMIHESHKPKKARETTSGEKGQSDLTPQQSHEELVHPIERAQL